MFFRKFGFALGTFGLAAALGACDKTEKAATNDHAPLLKDTVSKSSESKVSRSPAADNDAASPSKDDTSVPHEAPEHRAPQPRVGQPYTEVSNQEELDQHLKTSGLKIVLLTMNHCGPCHRTVDEAQAMVHDKTKPFPDDVEFIMINTENHSFGDAYAVANRDGSQSRPQLTLFKNGESFGLNKIGPSSAADFQKIIDDAATGLSNVDSNSEHTRWSRLSLSEHLQSVLGSSAVADVHSPAAAPKGDHSDAAASVADSGDLPPDAPLGKDGFRAFNGNADPIDHSHRANPTDNVVLGDDGLVYRSLIHWTGLVRGEGDRVKVPNPNGDGSRIDGTFFNTYKDLVRYWHAHPHAQKATETTAVTAPDTHASKTLDEGAKPAADPLVKGTALMPAELSEECRKSIQEAKKEGKAVLLYVDTNELMCDLGTPCGVLPEAVSEVASSKSPTYKFCTIKIARKAPFGQSSRPHQVLIYQPDQEGAQSFVTFKDYGLKGTETENTIKDTISNTLKKQLKIAPTIEEKAAPEKTEKKESSHNSYHKGPVFDPSVYNPSLAEVRAVDPRFIQNILEPSQDRPLMVYMDYHICDLSTLCGYSDFIAKRLEQAGTFVGRISGYGLDSKNDDRKMYLLYKHYPNSEIKSGPSSLSVFYKGKRYEDLEQLDQVLDMGSPEIQELVLQANAKYKEIEASHGHDYSVVAAANLAENPAMVKLLDMMMPVIKAKLQIPDPDYVNEDRAPSTTKHSNKNE